MIDNPSVAERLSVLGFSDAVVREFVAAVPTVRSATKLTPAIWSIRIIAAFTLGAVLTSLLYLAAYFIWTDVWRACGVGAFTNVKAAALLQYLASGGALVLAEVWLVSRASRNFQMRYYVRPLFLAYRSGFGPGTAQRILAKHPNCRTADDFLQVFKSADFRLYFRGWAAFQAAVPLAFFAIPALCG